MTAGSCTISSAGTSYSECYVSATAYVYLYSYLLDLTNGTYYAGSSTLPSVSEYTEWYLYCYAGNCSASFAGSSGSFSKVVSGTSWFDSSGFNPTHQYALISTVYSETYAYASTYGTATLVGSHANAMLDLSKGHGATLNWVETR
jgi:hypothetical protein